MHYFSRPLFEIWTGNVDLDDIFKFNLDIIFKRLFLSSQLGLISISVGHN